MKNRIEWIDTAKGIGMILVIIVHLLTQSGNAVLGEKYKHFVLFVLVMFYILSGFVAKPKNISKWEFLKKTAYSYLLPIYIYGIVFTLLKQLYAPSSWKSVISGFFFFHGSTFYIVSPAWFVITLFMTVIIFRFCRLDMLIPFYRFILACILLFAGFLFYRYDFPDYFGIFRLPVALGFYLIGNIAGNYYSVFRKYRKKHILALIILAICIPVWFASDVILNDVINISEGYYGNYLCFIAGSLCGTYICCYISYLLKNIKFLGIYGRNTLFTLIVQKIIYRNWVILFSSLLPVFWFKISFVLCFAILIFVPNPLCRYLSEHCPCLVGKPFIKNT